MPTTRGRSRRDAARALTSALCWVVPAYAVLLLPTFVDRLHPTSGSSISLTGTVVLVAWWFAESGQTVGIVIIASVLLVVLVSRPGISVRRRLAEAGVVAGVSVVALYGGSLVNDHLVKPTVGVARPDIVALADLDLLGMDVDAFYDLPETARSAHLASISDERGFGELEMRSEVRDHWVKETAFSRPSGHALASMTLVTMYVSIAMAWLSSWRRWTFLLLVPWATAVCLSRPILRVHWPVDVLLGGAAGIVLGAAGWFTTWILVVWLDAPDARPPASDAITAPGTSPGDPGSSC